MLYANYYHQDRIKNASFELIDKHHTYNPTYTNRLLRAEFLLKGIELNNPDVNVGKLISFSILHDGQADTHPESPSYLIATENPYICPANADETYLQKFKGVFTWNQNLFHLPNVIPLFIPNQIRQNPFSSFSDRKIFACLINANKAFPRPTKKDLYLERIQVIKWYEKYAPDFFSLYGLGWQKPEPAFSFQQKCIRRMKRLGTQLFGYKPFPSYAGEIENKSDVYKMAKFAYCYENVADLPNYISEKIFDCFFDGCVPVYWGSNTIDQLIPADCYIDRRKFNSTEAVHQFLLSINEVTYSQYQENIKKFLASEDAMKFDTATYASIITNTIQRDLSQ